MERLSTEAAGYTVLTLVALFYVVIIVYQVWKNYKYNRKIYVRLRSGVSISDFTKGKAYEVISVDQGAISKRRYLIRNDFGLRVHLTENHVDEI